LTDVSAATEIEIGSRADSQTAPTVTRVPARRGHILVVEDDAPIRSMLVDLLSDAGYSTTEVNTGVEALGWLGEHQPDLLVLDLMMPAMSGWEFLSRSRELDRLNVPVIILSAIDGRSDYPSLLGATAWFTKPLDIPRFLGVVERLAGRARASVIV
jgi:CheY-like chemotaxis protein